MAYLICFIGLFTAVMGCSVVMHPAVLSKILQFCKKPPFLYLSSGIKAAIGILFLIWATSCNRPWIIILVGILHHWQSFDVLYAQNAESKTLRLYPAAAAMDLSRLGAYRPGFGVLIIWAGWPK
jgi:hypothetical protein